MLNRRAFLSFSAGATVGLMITPIPWKLTDDASIWTQNWKWNPKVPKRAIYFAEMASKMDPSGAGIRVASVEGCPVGVAGNPDHPMGKGAVSAMAAAEIGLLYSPSRVKTPMVRTESGFAPISWEKAEAMLTEKLGEARGRVAMVSGDETGSANEIFNALVANLEGEFFMMPGEAQSAARSWKMMGGEGQIGYDIENADHVLFLGADALESSGTAVRNARAFSATHPSGKEALAKYVYAGPVLNSTATVCDEWVQARPGMAATVAMGLANILMSEGMTAAFSGFDAFRAEAAAFTPARVERETGVRARDLMRMAAELRSARRPLVVAGSEFGQGAGARAVLASLGLNAVLGRIGAEGGVKAVAEAPVVVPGAASRSEMFQADFVAFMQKVAEGRADVDVLMVYDANPAYGLPQAEMMAKALEKVPFTVSFSSFMDETAKTADLILPSSMPVERYDDVYTPYGAAESCYNVNRPIAKAAFDTRHTADVLLGAASRMGMDLGFIAFKDVLKAKTVALGASWGDLKKGQTWTAAAAPVRQLNIAACAVPSVEPAGNGALALAPVAKSHLGNGKIAIPPSNVSTIRDTEFDGSDCMVQMNAKTARMSGVKAGQKVRLSGPGGEMLAKVCITEKVMNGVVAAPLGFGHTAWDEFSCGMGDNAYKLLAAVAEPETGLTAWSGTRVEIATA
ncbi:anaerobic selenocysteine-containing dehydrogenase [Desulfobaculum xiamenense]|uniref:Anaerobic selenocysteine-containing dehydrogenase n=1 Tax=Desulfobaculum xiamenense TaxID=995050 RepID=A0A846QL57_9BACT|nr:menaquinone reductase molybdopterin-binding-like subunit QrcB [Desulfobaculum xiamenense]NJB67917.1 anaerobic selenocysteine-containing dehydrogenase [Desulfobaculum xiamenense]